ncbi:hypothetical protein BJ508DRAFT_333611 [Ascobolus immersus RN42]|uniref:Uncharacterized protein n=1 Tax=Ascobolus immersus RN42 TaxID=1160509 RepID=A0A3N4HJ10_ASCIM|nr:hypothetical protein BJ508DRAFT_333611 [Ascobolus immersus RN42]
MPTSDMSPYESETVKDITVLSIPLITSYDLHVSSLYCPFKPCFTHLDTKFEESDDLLGHIMVHHFDRISGLSKKLMNAYILSRGTAHRAWAVKPVFVSASSGSEDEFLGLCSMFEEPEHRSDSESDYLAIDSDYYGQDNETFDDYDPFDDIDDSESDHPVRRRKHRIPRNPFLDSESESEPENSSNAGKESDKRNARPKSRQNGVKQVSVPDNKFAYRRRPSTAWTWSAWDGMSRPSSRATELEDERSQELDYADFFVPTGRPKATVAADKKSASTDFAETSKDDLAMPSLKEATDELKRIAVRTTMSIVRENMDRTGERYFDVDAEKWRLQAVMELYKQGVENLRFFLE